MACDASAPAVALITKTALLFLSHAPLSSPPVAADVLMTHVPETAFDQAVAMQFPGGGGLDRTTAILCCSVKSPIVVLGFEAECDQLRVQWCRLISQLRQTPAINLELTSLRCEYMQQPLASHDPLSPTKTWFFSPSKTFPSPSSLSRSPAPLLQRARSSSSPIDSNAYTAFKISALFDGTVQVSTSFTRFCVKACFQLGLTCHLAGLQQRLQGLGLCCGAVRCKFDH